MRISGGFISKPDQDHGPGTEVPGQPQAEVEAAANGYAAPGRPPSAIPGAEVEEACPRHPPRRARGSEHRRLDVAGVRGLDNRAPHFLPHHLLAALGSDCPRDDPDRAFDADDAEVVLDTGVEVNEPFPFESDPLQAHEKGEDNDHGRASQAEDAPPVNGRQV